ncbi:MAG: RNA-protein complex protein Nop10 [Desulfurococcales archaeon]|nr:RNA-protein complex protein Nop10 [Desulfurococcales archaeon]
MVWLLRKCIRCSKYTMRESCPICGSQTVVPYPPRFSPQDRYVAYRVRARKTFQ